MIKPSQILLSLNELRICISGDVGSGKSVVRNYLSKTLHLPSYSTGDFQRQIAASKSMTTLELNQYSENNKEIDLEIDAMSTRLGKEEKKFIIDSRLAWYFIPQSFKVFLQVDSKIAAKRIINAGRILEEYKSVTEAIGAIEARGKSEQQRYLKFYGVDLRDFNQYDLVANTTYQSIDDVCNGILNCLNFWANKEPFPQYLFN